MTAVSWDTVDVGAGGQAAYWKARYEQLLRSTEGEPRLPVIRRVDPASHSGYCCVVIPPARLAAGGLTSTTRRRHSANHQRGSPPDQCTLAATHVVDQKFYCRSHAATIALRALQGE